MTLVFSEVNPAPPIVITFGAMFMPKVMGLLIDAALRMLVLTGANVLIVGLRLSPDVIFVEMTCGARVTTLGARLIPDEITD